MGVSSMPSCRQATSGQERRSAVKIILSEFVSMLRLLRDGKGDGGGVWLVREACVNAPLMRGSKDRDAQLSIASIQA